MTALDPARATLLSLLGAHSVADDEEAEDCAFISRFVAAHADCLSRRCVPGHLTGSAFLVHPDGSGLLLLHHRKLDRWLQPGGHMAAGEHEPWQTALREATEETGLAALEPIHAAGTDPRAPLDVDVHLIPERPGEPAHHHLDWRYAFRVLAPETARGCEEETRGLRWFAWAELEDEQFDPAFRRAARKARALATPKDAAP